MSAAAYAIAMITSIQGTVAIKDATVAARAVTRIYAALAGFAVIAAIALIDRSLLAVNVLLLVVIFLAVYARRFGPRWQGIGMFTFMCCVIGAFLKPQETVLTDVALSLCISGVIAHLVRNFVLPERPETDFRRSTTAAATLIDTLAEQIRRNALSGWPSQRKKAAISLERRAREMLVLCESYLPASPDGTFVDSNAATLATRLFDLQLAMENCLSVAIAPIQANSQDLSAELLNWLAVSEPNCACTAL